CQAVQDQDNGKDGRPVAQSIDAGAAGRIGVGAGGQDEKGDGDRQEQEGRHEADGGFQWPPLFADQHHQQSCEERDDDRRYDEVIEPAAHCFGSLPSTWSVPVKPRAASSTTRKSAVVAKPMTIAVSTSA